MNSLATRPIVAGLLLLLLAACDSRSAGDEGPLLLTPRVPSVDQDQAEDEIYRVEQHLAGLADQVREMSLEGAVAYFPERYAGTPLLADPPPDRSVDNSIPGYTIETWEGEESVDVDRAASMSTLTRFLKPVATLDHVRLKVVAGEWRAERFEADAKILLDVTLQSGGRLSIQARYDVALEELEDGDGLRIISIARRSGRRVRTDRPTFVDATGPMGLTVDVFTEIHKRQTAAPMFGDILSYLGGVAVGDVDGDGFPDVLFNRIGERRLFRNVDGKRFEEITFPARIWSQGPGSGALFFDYDNDGDQDLLALSCAPKMMIRLPSMTLYRNDGTGRFKNVTEEAGMKDTDTAFSATAADIDLDGDLDVYVSFYFSPRVNQVSVWPEDILAAEDAPPNRLWINNGDGTFTESAAEAGVADTGWSFASAFGDFNGDGLPDLYVANDFGRNRLYRNMGSGSFKDVTAETGVADTGFGMGVAWGDYDGDGRMDIYVSNMYSTAGGRILDRGSSELKPDQYRGLRRAVRGNTLLSNCGDGTFADVTEKAGVGNAGWAWDTHFFDYDNDGALDIYTVNGYISGATMTDM